MKCPDAVGDILISILRAGVLRIRAKGWEENAEACATEADHLHNIPDLLSDFSLERLSYYWEVERRCFMEHVGPEEVREFLPSWERLAAHIPLSESKKQEVDRATRA